jgi:hypothetical protein
MDTPNRSHVVEATLRGRTLAQHAIIDLMGALIATSD